MITKLEAVVPAAVEEMSAAEYANRAWPMLGKNRVNALISQRQIRLNGVREGRNSTVHGGDLFTLYLDGEYDRSLKIIEQDKNLIAFVKPRGLPVDQDEYGIGEDTALSRLKLINSEVRLVHRLDTGTAGIMLAGIGAASEKELTALFKNHLLIKKYSATVLGHLPKKSDTLRGYLVKDESRSIVSVSDRRIPGAFAIETRYSVNKEYKKANLILSRLDIIIPTGRTHQIRAHMAHIGHPLLGDDKYGDRSVNRFLGARETDLTSVDITVKNVPEAGHYAGRRFSFE